MSYIIELYTKVMREKSVAPSYIIWSALADAWGLDSDYSLQELAPPGKCPVCWGYNVCAECLGKYPHQCPGECKDGTCPVCRGQYPPAGDDR